MGIIGFGPVSGGGGACDNASECNDRPARVFWGLVFDVCMFRVNRSRVNHLDGDMTGGPSESSLSSSCA